MKARLIPHGTHVMWSNNGRDILAVITPHPEPVNRYIEHMVRTEDSQGLVRFLEANKDVIVVGEG